MKSIVLMFTMLIIFLSQNSSEIKDVKEEKCNSCFTGAHADVEKFIIYPSPVTTEINIEFNDSSFADGLININDMGGRKFVFLPIKGRDRVIIQLDRRFVPGNYVIDVIQGKTKISRSFSVID